MTGYRVAVENQAVGIVELGPWQSHRLARMVARNAVGSRTTQRAFVVGDEIGDVLAVEDELGRDD